MYRPTGARMGKRRDSCLASIPPEHVYRLTATWMLQASILSIFIGQCDHVDRVHGRAIPPAHDPSATTPMAANTMHCHWSRKQTKLDETRQAALHNGHTVAVIELVFVVDAVTILCAPFAQIESRYCTLISVRLTRTRSEVSFL